MANLLDCLTPRTIEPRNARIVHLVGGDNPWATPENVKHREKLREKKGIQQAVKTYLEKKREYMAAKRASRPEKRENKMMMDAIIELLRGKPHYGRALAERLGVKMSRLSSILAFMSRQRMIVRDAERKPWRVK